MKKLLRFLNDFKKECVWGPLFKLLEAGFELLVPLVMAAIIDRGIANADRPYIGRLCGVLAALALVGLVCSVTAQYFAAKAATGFATKLRHALFSHILGLSYAEIDSLGASTMITRMTSDVNQLQNGINLALRLLLRSPFVVFGAMAMAFTIDVRAALIFAVAIPVLFAGVFAIILITIPMYRQVQSRLDGITSATRENLAGVRVLRAFRKEGEQVAGFFQRNRQLYRMQLQVGRLSNLLNPVTYVILNLAVLVLIQTGAVRVNHGALSQGQVVALYNYMTQILVELIKFANLIITMTKTVACGNRVQGIFEIVSSQKPGTERQDVHRGRVEFQQVGLTFPGGGAEAISDVDFVAEPGQTIGIIGGTGSGKSALVNLIPRFYDATRGTVRVDGVDVKELSMHALREQIGVVPQKAVLFQGTIRSNLLWGNPEATDEDLLRALKLAQADEFVRAKDGGLDAAVEQGGRNFSGGQRQRLTIARALVRQPRVLILDDSASALDYVTDAKLRSAIRTMPEPPTTFIVSQRAASIRHADLIFVLEDGKVAGRGTHQELLESCPIYQEIYYSQFPKEAESHGA